MAFADGYDMSTGPIKLDTLAKIYISIAVIWTAALIPGIVILLRNAQLPYLRIRNIPLVISSVCTLHVYLFLCYMVYMLKGNFPCSTEFWIMSIYLPLGIALYQAANTQLLHISALQKRFALTLDEEGESKRPRKRGWRYSMEVLMDYSPTQRTLTFVAVGMLLQFVCALVIFMISKKFNHFGVVGKPVIDDDRGRFKCRKGWEWWPSIAWQFAWSWIYAPYLLWKVNGIKKDVHGWRMQTIVCCLAGLPASPLWLAALNAPRMMNTVSLYWVPPLWFTPSIMLMQGFAIFGPCAQIYKNRKLENETRLIIAEWEHKKKYGTSLSSDSTRAGSKSMFSLRSTKTGKSSGSSRNAEMYTMAALEKSLKINPKPLLLFAAHKDFSGENIKFLELVNEWKENWLAPSSPRPAFTRSSMPDTRDQLALRRTQFALGVTIYSLFVHGDYAPYPINISSSQSLELDALFGPTAAKLHPRKGSKHSSTSSFDAPWAAKLSDDLENATIKDQFSVTTTAIGGDQDIILLRPEQKVYNEIQSYNLQKARKQLPKDTIIPDNFGATAFDNVEKHIKQLVLTNTWPKFVNDGFANKIPKSSLKERAGDVMISLRRMVTKRSHQELSGGDV